MKRGFLLGLTTAAVAVALLGCTKQIQLPPGSDASCSVTIPGDAP